VESNDSGLTSSNATDLIKGLMGISGQERGVVKNNAVIKDDAGDDLENALKVKSSLSSNETNRFKKVFGIFKDVVFPGPEAEKLQSAKIQEKMPVKTADKDSEKLLNGKSGFLTKLLGLIGIALTFLKDKLLNLFNLVKGQLDDLVKNIAKALGYGKPPKPPKPPKPSRSGAAGLRAPKPSKPGSVSKPGSMWQRAKTATSNVIGRAKTATSNVISKAKKPLGAAAEFISKNVSVRALGKLAKGVPLLGGAIETIFATMDIKSLIARYKNKEIERAELNDLVGRRVMEGLGAIGGATIGTALGLFLGGPVGAFVGGLGGDFAGRLVMRKVLEKLEGDGMGTLGSTVLDMFKVNLDRGEDIQQQIQEFRQRQEEPDAEFIMNEPLGDFIRHHDGSITPISERDDLLGMKTGGAIDRLIDSAFNRSGNKLSDNLLQEDIGINKQIALISQEQTELLRAIVTNTSKLMSQAAPVTILGGSSVPKIMQNGVRGLMERIY
jgi:hypothetical protein